MLSLNDFFFYFPYGFSIAWFLDVRGRSLSLSFPSLSGREGKGTANDLGRLRIRLASLLLLFFLRNRFIGSLLSTPLINRIHNLLVNNIKGEGGLKERGELKLAYIVPLFLRVAQLECHFHINSHRYFSSSEYRPFCVVSIGRLVKTIAFSSHIILILRLLSLPILTKKPSSLVSKMESATIQETCQAEGYPPPKLTWTRLVMLLPAGKTEV